MNEKRKLAKETCFLIPARGRQNIISIVDSDPTQSFSSFKINMLFSNSLLEIIRGERTDKFFNAASVKKSNHAKKSNHGSVLN